MEGDIEELLLGDVILHYPDADTANFLSMKEDGAQAELDLEEPDIRIQGRNHLSALLVQDHNNILAPSRFFVGGLLFKDSESVPRDVEAAIENKGWQVDNMDKLRQLWKLNRIFTSIANSVHHVGLALGHREIDFWELGSIERNISQIVCTLQPEHFRAQVALVFAQIRCAFESFPPEPEDEETEAPPYPPGLVAMLSEQVEDLAAAISMLKTSYVSY